MTGCASTAQHETKNRVILNSSGVCVGVMKPSNTAVLPCALPARTVYAQSRRLSLLLFVFAGPVSVLPLLGVVPGCASLTSVFSVFVAVVVGVVVVLLCRAVSRVRGLGGITSTVIVTVASSRMRAARRRFFPVGGVFCGVFVCWVAARMLAVKPIAASTMLNVR